MTELTPRDREFIREKELEKEDPTVLSLLQSRGGATGDSQVDWFIKQKVAEDRLKPPTTFTQRLERKEPITSFTGGHSFLSNDQECQITALGRNFRSVIEAYDAIIAANEDNLGWDYVACEMAMRNLLDQKFSRHEWLLFSLLGTGHAHIEYVNDWGDKFWGTDVNVKNPPLVYDITETLYDGDNRLGKMLMEIRHECRLRIAGNIRLFERDEVGVTDPYK